MRPRLACLAVCVASLAAIPAAEAVRLWEQGQQAMLDGDADRAIVAYRESLRLDPKLVRNQLSLAAAYLEKGDDNQAAAHMSAYVRSQPDHVVVRAHLAELLLRLARPLEAREQFERFVAAAQGRPALADEHLVHCHSRLMEIAEGQEDDYGEHLNRGIGLYLLAKQRASLPDPEGELSTEGLLCKAAGELTEARQLRPDEARPCWYLHAVWTQLAQTQPAARWLRAAEEAAAFSYLTPTERSDLALACRRGEAERSRK